MKCLMMRCVVGVSLLLVLAAISRAEPPLVLKVAKAGASQTTPWQFFCEDDKSVVGDVWSVKDGVLVCQGSPRGYLYTAQRYRDFTLKLEWRWPLNKKPGNAGVLIRTSGKQKIWPRSLEAQLNVGQSGDFWGLAGFPLQGPADRLEQLDHEQYGKLTHLKRLGDYEKPQGEWNQYEIIAAGEKVTLKVNGHVVNTATRCDVEPGWICLTAEGNEVHFRNLSLRVDK